MSSMGKRQRKPTAKAIEMVEAEPEKIKKESM